MPASLHLENESGRNRTGVVLLKRELPGQRGRRTRMVGRPGFEPGVSGLRVRRLSLDACDPNGVAGSRGIEPLFSDRQSDGLPLAYDPRWIAPRLVAAAQAGSGMLRTARSGTRGVDTWSRTKDLQVHSLPRSRYAIPTTQSCARQDSNLRLSLRRAGSFR